MLHESDKLNINKNQKVTTLARYLNISRETAFKMLSECGLQPIRFTQGGNYYVRWQDLAYLKSIGMLTV